MHSKASISEPHQHCNTAQPSLKYGAQHQNISLISKGTPQRKLLSRGLLYPFTVLYLYGGRS